MKLKVMIFGLLVFGFAEVTEAQTATPKVTNRQVTQQKRIRQGVRSGELTKKETVKLQAQQAHIQRTKKRAKADGVVTKKERAQIHKKQNRANRNIRRQKHDGQDRN